MPPQVETTTTAARPPCQERAGVEKLAIAQTTNSVELKPRSSRRLRPTTTTQTLQSSSANARRHQDETLSQSDLLSTQQQTSRATIQTEKTTKQRIKWTEELNKEVMRCYFLAEFRGLTKVKGTYDTWKSRNQFPEVVVAVEENQLSNQRQAILRNGYLNQTTLDNLKEEARRAWTDMSGTFTDPITTPTNENAVSQAEQRPEEEDEASNPQMATTTSQSDLPMPADQQVGTLAPPDGTQGRYEAQHRSQLRNGPQDRAQRRQRRLRTQTTPQDGPRVVEVEEMEVKIRAKLLELQMRSLNERNKIATVKITRTIREQLRVANLALERIAEGDQLSITELNQLMYATASVIAGEMAPKPTNAKPKTEQPAWERRLQLKIEKLRQNLSTVSEAKKENPSQYVAEKAEGICRNLNADLAQASMRIKMRLMATAQRLRGYKRRKKQYLQNKMFRENAKLFYRQLNEPQGIETEPPPQEKIEEFWAGILEDSTSHNTNANWIKQEADAYGHITEQQWCDFTVSEIKNAIKKSQNWKSPGPDMLQNFWIKHLSALHQQLTDALNGIIRDPKAIPRWLTSGVTYLLPKGKDPMDPKNYRPITCLPTTYKILTAVITTRLYNHLLENHLLPAEQKGCRRASRGCKDQLLISKMVIETAKKRKKNLSLAWIDYKKAFDSVPHSWILQVLDIYRVSPVLRQFVAASMKEWRTTMRIKSITTRELAIKRGIFQGDSLSPLIFCLALTPLTNMLNRREIGYMAQPDQSISHLLYMDDLKLLAKNRDQLREGLETVKEFSDDIRMGFGLDKCAIAHIEKGKLVSCENMKLDENTEIKSLNQGEFYKYLGVDECDGINHSKMKATIAKEYYRRVRKILETELNAQNKIAAINCLAIPVPTYSFGIVDWTKAEVKKLDTKTRKLLNMYGMHHPKANVQRLYIKRQNGGRGLMEIKAAHENATVGLSEYLRLRTDRLTEMVNNHEAEKKRYSLHQKADEIATQYQLTRSSSTLKKCLKESTHKNREIAIRAMPLHGQFWKRIDQDFVDKKATFQWMRSSGLKGGTESLIMAAQDQALNTRWHQSNIQKIQGVSSKCRLCNRFDESISHIVAGCEMLTATDYTERHNKVASYLHWHLLKEFGYPVTEMWYDHVPQTTVEIESARKTVLWDMNIATNHSITATKPDIVVRGEGEWLLIEVSVPDDGNILAREAEKLTKYKPLELEIRKNWSVRTRVIPVVIGALGTMKNGFENHLEYIPGKVRASQLQKIALLGTARILRKFLM